MCCGCWEECWHSHHCPIIDWSEQREWRGWYHGQETQREKVGESALCFLSAPVGRAATPCSTLPQISGCVVFDSLQGWKKSCQVYKLLCKHTQDLRWISEDWEDGESLISCYVIWQKSLCQTLFLRRPQHPFRLRVKRLDSNPNLSGGDKLHFCEHVAAL